ncbi:MAG TPA: excisionase family DNA-binding protein [Conexibacter sp.]
MATSRASRVTDAERLREQAQRLADAASSARAGKAPTIAALGLDDVVLPPSVLEAAAEVLREQAQGRESDIVVVRETLSTQQAADLLGVSRPHLTMLLDRDRIPYQTTAGGHRRIRRSDIEDYHERQALAHAAMRESMRSADELADDE